MPTERVDVIISAQDQASSVIRGVSKEVDGFMSRALKGAQAGVGFFAAQQIQQAISSAFTAATDAVVGFNASLEQSRIAWSTMLGGAAQAERMLRDLQVFAERTPFEFEDAERGARRLVAMGIPANRILGLMEAIAASAAGLGVGTEGIDRIGRALGQMSTRTKVSAEDMLQLTEVGVPAWQILANATGRSVAQIQDDVTKGKVAADVMLNAFENFARSRWGSLLEEQANTFTGAMSNIRDTMRRTLADTFQPLFAGLTDLAQAFLAFIKSEGVKSFAEGLRNAFVAMGVFIDVVRRSEPILKVLAAAFIGVAAAITISYIPSIAAAAGAALAAIPSLIRLGVAVTASAGPWAVLAIAIAAAALVIIANWEQLSGAAGQAAAAIGQRWEELSNWFSQQLAPSLQQAGQQAWGTFANYAIDALNAAAQAWATFWGQEMGPAGQEGFTLLQDQARTGWTNFVRLASEALGNVLGMWNGFVALIGGLKAANIPLPFWLEALEGKFADTEAITKQLETSLEAVPGVATRAFSAVQRFVFEDVPAAVARTVALVQGAVGDLGGFSGALTEELQRRLREISDAFGGAGQNAGAAMADGVVKGMRPLVEELRRLFAQLRAEPAAQALEDVDRAIEGARLILADLSQPLERRQAAMRQLIELQSRVRPTLAVEAFEAGEELFLAKRAEDMANLRIQVAQTMADLAKSQGEAAAVPIATATTAAVTAATPAAAGVSAAGAPQAVVMSALEQIGGAIQDLRQGPQQIALRIEVTGDGPIRVYEELIEANGQAQTPPVIEISGLRR